MADDIPFDPDESDITFEHVLEHSHEHALEASKKPALPKQLTSEQKELAVLDSAWKKGELSYHEYMSKKYSVQRENRGWNGERKKYQ